MTDAPVEDYGAAVRAAVEARREAEALRKQIDALLNPHGPYAAIWRMAERLSGEDPHQAAQRLEDQAERLLEERERQRAAAAGAIVARCWLDQCGATAFGLNFKTEAALLEALAGLAAAAEERQRAAAGRGQVESVVVGGFVVRRTFVTHCWLDDKGDGMCSLTYMLANGACTEVTYRSRLEAERVRAALMGEWV